MEPPKDEATVKLGILADYICKSDGTLLLKKLNVVAASFELTDLERMPLDELKSRFEYENLFLRMFETWMKRMEERNKTPTLACLTSILNDLDLCSVEVNLKSKFQRLDRLIELPKQKPPEPAEVEPVDQDKLKEEAEAGEKAKEDVKGTKDLEEKPKAKGIKKLFSSKKVSVKTPGGIAAAGLLKVENPLSSMQEEDDDPIEEIRYLPDEDAKQLLALVAPFHDLDTSLQIIQFLCRTVYHTAVCVPKEDYWIRKVALIAMEMFSIVRHFIEPGRAIRKDKFESVIRRYVVDPGLAPQLISALAASGMLIKKEDEKRALLLNEPAVKDAIDELQECDSILQILETPYPGLAKVQEKLLIAVVAAVEEHKSYDDQKAFGKKLSPHISYLVREIVWPRKHPGFNNVQAKIPKVIRFCDESVIAVAKQRYESLPNVSDEDLAIFEKAYAKAQEEKLNVGAIFAAGAIGAGVGVGAALTIGAIDD